MAEFDDSEFYYPEQDADVQQSNDWFEVSESGVKIPKAAVYTGAFALTAAGIAVGVIAGRRFNKSNTEEA